MTVKLVSDNTPFAAGDAFTVTFTLLTDQAATDLTGATVTSTITYYNNDVIADHAMTVTDATGGICTLAITAAQSATLKPGLHLGDVKTVIAGVTKHYGPYSFDVREAIT